MGKEYTVSYRSDPGTSPFAAWRKRRKPQRLPLIRISGKWINRLGFPIGAKVELKAEPGRLVLTALDEIGADPVPVSEVCEPEAEE